ncbi:MAG: hypothetical protein IPK18_11465 [Sphingobacteriales bacterium]|nr:MAG: hypothetical protein IPK18_11465 [Sphingobacteriales bacterium]
MKIFINKYQKKLQENDKHILEWVSNNLLYSFILIFILIIIIVASIFIITSLLYNEKEILDPNEIGHTIGGIIGPIIAFFSAFLVYIAFKEQKKANEIQLKIIEDEKINNLSEKQYGIALSKYNRILHLYDNLMFYDEGEIFKSSYAIFELTNRILNKKIDTYSPKFKALCLDIINVDFGMTVLFEYLHESENIDNYLKKNLFNEMNKYKTPFKMLKQSLVVYLEKNPNDENCKLLYFSFSQSEISFNKYEKLFDIKHEK